MLPCVCQTKKYFGAHVGRHPCVAVLDQQSAKSDWRRPYIARSPNDSNCATVACGCKRGCSGPDSVHILRDVSNFINPIAVDLGVGVDASCALAGSAVEPRISDDVLPQPTQYFS